MALLALWGRGAKALRQTGRDAATSPRRIRQLPRGVNIHAAIGQHLMVTVVPALSVTTPPPAPSLKESGRRAERQRSLPARRALGTILLGFLRQSLKRRTK